mgnify:CR=1 FL=1
MKKTFTTNINMPITITIEMCDDISIEAIIEKMIDSLQSKPTVKEVETNHIEGIVKLPDCITPPKYRNSGNFIPRPRSISDINQSDDVTEHFSGKCAGCLKRNKIFTIQDLTDYTERSAWVHKMSKFKFMGPQRLEEIKTFLRRYNVAYMDLK